MAEHAHDPALGVGLDLFVADMAVQPILVEALDASLADRLGTAVLGAVEGLGFLLVDPADIAHRVRKVLIERVLTDKLRLYIKPGRRN